MNISYANPRGYGTVQPDYLIVSVVATSLSSGVIASSRGEEESRETEKNVLTLQVGLSIKSRPVRKRLLLHKKRSQVKSQKSEQARSRLVRLNKN